MLKLGAKNDEVQRRLSLKLSGGGVDGVQVLQGVGRAGYVTLHETQKIQCYIITCINNLNTVSF